MRDSAVGGEVVVRYHQVPCDQRDNHRDPKEISEAAIFRRVRTHSVAAAVLHLLRRSVEIRGRGFGALGSLPLPLVFGHGWQGRWWSLAVGEGGGVSALQKGCLAAVQQCGAALMDSPFAVVGRGSRGVGDLRSV